MVEDELAKAKAEIRALRAIVGLLAQAACDNYSRTEGLRMTLEARGIPLDGYAEHRAQCETAWHGRIANEFTAAAREANERAVQRMLERFNDGKLQN